VNEDSVKKALLLKRERPVMSAEGALSTGSTLLNLACTDHPDLGFLKGGYYYLVGDSTSGKTWLSLTCFAEATINKAFKDYRLIFDDVEGGALMDVEYYFGKEVARRMESPSMRGKIPVFSDTVESFYYHLADLIKDGCPFIYVLDSQDSLTSDSSSKKFAAQKGAAEKGEEAAGSYGDGKAKYHSEHIRHVLAGLRKTKSILIIIGQTRDNLGFGFETKTRSGGRALRFYANLEIWTSVGGKILKYVRGKERTVGVKCLAEVKKNRVTGKIGKDRMVQVPIYYGLGIDDVGSCVDYLILEEHWKKAKAEGGEDSTTKKGKKIIDAHDLLFQGTRGQIIGYIEEEGLEKKVRELTAKVWSEVEAECEPNRKRRYE
jgi:RecA/RadA recombinase